MNQPMFSSISTYYAKVGNWDQVTAISILSEYFPSLESTRVRINSQTPWDDGGTFLKNFPLTEHWAEIISKAIAEMNCNGSCFFIVPIPACHDIFLPGGIEPSEYQVSMILDMVMESCAKIHAGDYSTGFPALFALHSHSKSLNCITVMQNIVEQLIVEYTEINVESVSEFNTLMKKVNK